MGRVYLEKNKVGLSESDSRLKPGSYPLGSPQSRAAARADLERRFSARRRIEIVCSIPRPCYESEITIGAWIEGPDGTLTRFINLPAEMTIEEAEKAAQAKNLQSTTTDSDSRTERTGKPFLPASAAAKGLGSLALGSGKSR